MTSAAATEVLTIKHTPAKVVGWACLVLCLSGAVAAWTAGARGPALLLIGVMSIGAYIVLGSGSMQMNSDSVYYSLPLRSYQIKWNEVKYMEIDRQGGNMVLAGENKRLAMVGPYLWSGKNRVRTLRFIGEQIEKHGIEVRTTEKAMFRLSKNTKSHY